MKIIIPILFIFGSVIVANGQHDSLLDKYKPGGNEYQNLVSYLGTWKGDAVNKYDSAGKKHGKWIVYLGTHWKPVTDSNKAVFYKYTYYDHGFNIYNNEVPPRKGWKLDTSGRSPQQNGKIALLDGEYKWVDKNGKITFISIFKNGIPVLMLDSNPSNKLQHDTWNYLEHWRNQPHSFFVSISDKKGSLKNYYMHKTINQEKEKAPNHWALFQEENN